jgi:hypothetical protein
LVVVDWRVAAAAATETFLPISATINNQVIRGLAMSSRAEGSTAEAMVGVECPKTNKNARKYRITTVMAIVYSWDWHLNATLF